MREADVDVAVGIPSQVLALARHDDALRLKSVLLSTDHVPVAVTRAVEDAWDCRVFGHYAMTEMGLGGGVECEARRGYHLREADLLVEVVHPRTGEPVADGDEGEVVFTTLTRAGMPLVRYRTGDLSRFLPGPCPCGTSLRTLERITRRAAGVVPLAGGRQLTLADLDEALLGVDAVLDFDAELVRRTASDRLDLTVRVTAGAGAGTAGALEAAVDGIPAIHRGRADGALDVGITLTPGRQVASAAKRRMRVVEPDA
jgi:phenylacetate-coenzyme A ligase PaaK-like adenylate-forming protein